MILKPFEPYELTTGLNALKNRLPANHPKYQEIVEDLGRQEAGDMGEEHVMSVLGAAELPKDTLVFHNITFYSKVDIQIDVLIVSPNWCLVMEVKNWTGALYFNDKPSQVICEKDGRERIYTNPESQLDSYCYGLNEFFRNHEIKIPIYGIIVFPFNNAAIKKPPVKFPIAVGRQYLKYLWTLPVDEKNNYSPPSAIANKLLQNNRSLSVSPLIEKYGIAPSEILAGVQCPSCGTFPIKRTLRTWYCPKCRQNNMYAHENALNDYSLLINKLITSQEALRFLNLRNRHEAKRMVQANSKLKIGTTKSSKYELEFK